MKPAVFVDRDGTLNRDCPYCKNAGEIEIYPDVFLPLAELSEDHYIIIITNQSGVGRGYFTGKDLEGMHDKIRREVESHGGRIDAVYYCPHLPGEGCACRKPNTGMLKKAFDEFDIDMSRSFFVGNSRMDVEAGRRAGIATICVRGDEGVHGDFDAKDFGEVLDIIKKNGDNPNPSELKVPKIGLILAGGRGKRMLPLTDEIPKPMAEVGGRPLIGHLVSEFKRNGILKIYVSIGYKGEIIEGYLGDGSMLGVEIEYVREREPLGTGGGMRMGLGAIRKMYSDSDVFVANGDDMMETDLAGAYEFHKKMNSDITLLLKRVDDVRGSGVVELADGKVTRFLEKPENPESLSGIVNLGRYIINPRIIEKFPADSAFSFEKDFMQKSADTLNMYGYLTDAEWHQINTIEALKNAEKDYSSKRNFVDKSSS